MIQIDTTFYYPIIFDKNLKVIALASLFHRHNKNPSIFQLHITKLRSVSSALACLLVVYISISVLLFLHIVDQTFEKLFSKNAILRKKLINGKKVLYHQDTHGFEELIA